METDMSASSIHEKDSGSICTIQYSKAIRKEGGTDGIRNLPLELTCLVSWGSNLRDKPKHPQT